MTPLTIDATKIATHDLFRWADFVELSCLLDADREAPLGETLREPWGFETGTVGAFLRQDDSDEDSEEDDLFEDEAAPYNDRVYRYSIHLTLAALGRVIFRRSWWSPFS